MGHSEFTSHDVFRWGGLNKSGAEILGALLATDNWTARITDLVDETGRSRSTVNRKLRRMFRLGLVEPISRGEWRVVPEFTPNMLERAAAELNTAGTRKRQVERHRQERIGHNLSLEENLAGES